MVHLASEPIPSGSKCAPHSNVPPYTLRIEYNVVRKLHVANQGITSKFATSIHDTLSFLQRKFATMHPQTTASVAYLWWAAADIMLA